MKVGRSKINELCYAAEGLSGTAAASSLRKLGSIMERAPAGRLLGAIFTLSDMSAKAAEALEQGSVALDRSSEDEAAARIADALAHMDGLAVEGAGRNPKRRAAR